MNISPIILSLREIKLLKSLIPSELETLATESCFKKILKGQSIYNVGQSHTHVYVVEKGSVKLGMIANCGRTLTKDISYEGEIFGENIFSSHHQHLEFAEAMTDSRVICIPVATFRLLIERNPKFASDIMGVIVFRLQHLEERLHNFVFKKAKERIVDFIYRSALRRGIKIGIDECLIDHGMSHKDIALLTDTSRQTVARILNDLKRANFIHYGSRKSSKILVRNLDRLLDYSIAV
ncbi:MAG: Crp/Fnr family transcriptional regulator [Saprospiraceae bacterium]